MADRKTVGLLTERLARSLVGLGFQRVPGRIRLTSEESGYYADAARWAPRSPTIQVWCDNYLGVDEPSFWFGIGGTPAVLERWKPWLDETYNPATVEYDQLDEDWMENGLWSSIHNQAGYSYESDASYRYFGRYVGRGKNLFELLDTALEVISPLIPLFISTYGTAQELDIKELIKRGTTTPRLVEARIGQGTFREGLFRIWKGCAVTGMKHESVLRASHIKPWRDCTDDADRLNPNNGLLLTANLDALFDQGLITFDASGTMCISERLNLDEIHELIGERRRLRAKLNDAQAGFLKHHREQCFVDNA